MDKRMRAVGAGNMDTDETQEWLSEKIISSSVVEVRSPRNSTTSSQSPVDEGAEEKQVVKFQERRGREDIPIEMAAATRQLQKDPIADLEKCVIVKAKHISSIDMSLTFRIKRSSTFERLKAEFCKRFNLATDARFVYDQYAIRPDQTPDSLGMKDEEEIDVYAYSDGGQGFVG